MLSVGFVSVYILLGSLVSFLSGLLGVGGGGILVPLLASIFAHQGMHSQSVVHFALGTALACMITSSIASLRAHAARGNVAWQAFYGMAPGIVAGSFLATCFAVKANSTFVALFFAIFMAIIAVQMFMNWKPKPSAKPMRVKDLLLTGIGIGAVSALAAVGGGFLTVTYLSYKNIDVKKAIGTSTAIGFPIAIAGTAGYMLNGWSITQGNDYTFGFIYVPAFLAISLSSFAAASYGASLALKLPEARLKKIFAIISFLLSIKMLTAVI